MPGVCLAQFSTFVGVQPAFAPIAVNLSTTGGDMGAESAIYLN